MNLYLSITLLVAILNFSTSYVRYPYTRIGHFSHALPRTSAQTYRPSPGYRFRSSVMSGPVRNEALGEIEAEALKAFTTSGTLRLHTNNETEKNFRSFPFISLGLPLLKDHDNYYSGTFGQCIWHQNEDQILIHIPLRDVAREAKGRDRISADRINSGDVELAVTASTISLSIQGKPIFKAVPLFRAVIPDGSFWTFEIGDTDKKRYIQIDLEKRQRMVNWNRLSTDSRLNFQTDKPTVDISYHKTTDAKNKNSNMTSFANAEQEQKQMAENQENLTKKLLELMQNLQEGDIQDSRT